MSNKHSHAVVLSYYEACGLTTFHNPYSSWSSKPKGKRQAREATRPIGIYSFDSGTSPPAQPEASVEVPPAIAGKNEIKRHRATSSVVTEIFAPEHPDSPSRESDASVESSKYSESSERCTPRTSMSLYGPLASPGTSRQSSASISEICRAKDPENWSAESADFQHDKNSHDEISLLETVSSKSDSADLFEPPAAVSNDEPFFYTQDFSSFLWEDISYLDSISRVRPDPQYSRRSFSIDEAVPPPIALHKNSKLSARKKTNRSSLRNLMTNIKRKTLLDDENGPKG